MPGIPLHTLNSGRYDDNISFTVEIINRQHKPRITAETAWTSVVVLNLQTGDLYKQHHEPALITTINCTKMA